MNLDRGGIDTQINEYIYICIYIGKKKGTICTWDVAWIGACRKNETQRVPEGSR